MTWTRWTRMFPTPLIVVVSLPIVAFASLTTALAFSTLCIRVAVVYVELFLALLQSGLNATSTPVQASRSIAVIEDDEDIAQQSLKTRRSRSASIIKKSVSSVSLPAKGLVSPLCSSKLSVSVPTSAVTPTAPTAIRDYEGVGGWHIGLEDNGELSPPAESSWLGSSNLLELPVLLTTPSPGKTFQRHHKRYGGQRVSTGSPKVRSPTFSERRNHRTVTSGTVSPEGYFNSQVNLHTMNSSARVARSEPADSGASRRSSFSMTMMRVPTRG